MSFRFGQTFLTNNPRIGTGTTQGTPFSRAHVYHMVVSKPIFGTDFRVTVGRITQEQSLAKIDSDTGLQFDEGPCRTRYITIAARHYFRGGLIQGSVSKADARDLSDGTPVPEAPHLIYDFLGTLDRLPLQLHARAEYEEVGRKTPGRRFCERSGAGVPFGALARRFGDRIQIGVNFQIAGGYTGQADRRSSGTAG